MLIIIWLCGQVPGVSAIPAPSPIRWVSFETAAVSGGTDDVINIAWDAKTEAVDYQIDYTDEAGATTTITLPASGGTEAAIPCSSVLDGRPLDIVLRYVDGTATVSDSSVPITLLCAGAPTSPATPTLLLRSLDLLLLEWEPPTSDGGSPILGYNVSMRESVAVGVPGNEWITIYNGTQNPATRTLAITEFIGQPLQVRGYEIAVRAFNWVGVSPDTELALVLVITVRTDALQSVVQPHVLLAPGNLPGYLDLLNQNPDGSFALARITAAVPAIIEAQARDTTGVDLGRGGSQFFVMIEELCTVTSNYRCDATPGRREILNGTMHFTMTDPDTGRYSSTIEVKRQGIASISVILCKVGGFYAEYFNNAFLDGVPTKTQIDSYLDFNWGTDLLTPEAADFVSIHWFGKIRAPSTEEFTFILSADDGVRMTVDGVIVVDRWDTCCDDISFGMNLTLDAFYDVVIEYKEHEESAHFKLEWVSLNVPREVVPPTRVYYPERVGGQVFQLQVDFGPSIPSACTADGELTHAIAGKRSYFYLQSRDWDGRELDNADDVFDIQFVGPSEGGPISGIVNSGSFAIVAEYGSGGQQLAQYIPQYAGTYVLTIMLQGEQIKSSPWTLFFYPGEIAPSKCDHSIGLASASPWQLPVQNTAGITLFFSLTIRDIYQNLIMDNRDNTSISISLYYTNHNDWTSPLAVPDLNLWEQIYGRDLAGLAVFSNATSQTSDNTDPSEALRTYDCQFTIYRAGIFSLEVKVNDVHVQRSPQTDQILIAPADLYAPNCIVTDLTLVMIAGDTFTNNIQTRDFYSNNKKTLFAATVQTWTAQVVELDSNGGTAATVVSTGTITDLATVTTDNSGAYQVSFTPTIAGTNFKILMTLNGLDVDNTADYRSLPLVVLPAITTDVLTSNYSVLALTNQSVIQWIDQETSRSWVYLTGDYFTVLIDIRDQFQNLRYSATTDVLLVELTGQTTGVVVSGFATSIGNGSFSLDLMFSKAEPYDLSIRLDSTTHIVNSPMTNRILVQGGLVQAAYTTLILPIAVLTAGESNTFNIQAKDIYQNIILDSNDYIGFELQETALATNLTTSVIDYRFELYAATFTLYYRDAYTGIVQVTQKNALQATYYTTVDYQSPVLLDSLHGHTASVGVDTYAVSGTTGDTTHFTRLDPIIDFDYGRLPLLVDLIPGTVSAYPTQYYSVIWKGFLKAPSSSLYRIHVHSYESTSHELSIGGEVISSRSFPAQTYATSAAVEVEMEAHADIWLEANQLNTFQLKYA